MRRASRWTETGPERLVAWRVPLSPGPASGSRSSIRSWNSGAVVRRTASRSPPAVVEQQPAADPEQHPLVRLGVRPVPPGLAGLELLGAEEVVPHGMVGELSGAEGVAELVGDVHEPPLADRRSRPTGPCPARPWRPGPAPDRQATRSDSCPPATSAPYACFLVSPRAIDQGDELLGGEHAEALGEELGDLVPVGGVVQDHPDDVAAPAGVEVRVAGVRQHVELLAGGPEGDERGRSVGSGRSRVGRVALALDGEHVGEGPLADQPPGARPTPPPRRRPAAPCRSSAPGAGPSPAHRRTRAPARA